jgi:exopolysaccharide biosynthesis WecB/TagA/CpsF family protein
VTVGTDLAERALRILAETGDPWTVIGMRSRALDALVARWRLRRPAHLDPPMGFDRDPAAFAAAARFVAEARGRFAFLAVGSPRQEALAHAIAARGGAAGLGLCIGAGLEFLSGTRKRAPTWMRRAGLEWLHRLGQEPGRLGPRYARDLAILSMLLRAARR